jgi:hypothetical protein
LYPEISKDHPGLIGRVINRAEAQLRRLSMIYALTDNTSEIDIPHLKAARAFWEYAESSAKYIFSGNDEKQLRKKIITFLRSVEKTKTELYRTLDNNYTKEQLDDSLAELEDLKLINCKEEKSSGPKPKTIYSLRI